VVHAQIMPSEILSPEEFASLLLVGNTPVQGLAPAIPGAHSARLIALGYFGGYLGSAAYDHAVTIPDVCCATR
jgi:hypothetical protein